MKIRDMPGIKWKDRGMGWDVERWPNDSSARGSLKKMQEAIVAAGVDLGEALLVIERNFPGVRFWTDIDIEIMPDIEMWFKNNWWRVYRVLEPDAHDKLMETKNNYSIWYRGCESGDVRWDVNPKDAMPSMTMKDVWAEFVRAKREAVEEIDDTPF